MRAAATPHIDWDQARVTVAWSIVQLPGQPLQEKATKNRRERSVAVDEFTLSMLRAQVEMLEARAASLEVELIDDHYIFSDSPDGSEPWKPGSVTLYFARLCERVGLEHLDLHYLRKLTETYGQDLGFSSVQVAMRAGHDPSVVAKHYTGSIEEKRPSAVPGRGVAVDARRLSAKMARSFADFCARRIRPTLLSSWCAEDPPL